VCVLTRPGRLDELTVRVEARPQAGRPATEDLGRQLAERVKARIGVSVGVEVVPPGTLERSLGKAKRVIDER
jgi:phenylacetate-CoA ligase